MLSTEELKAETPELKYARQTRNATVTIAWIVGIVGTIMLIFGIIVGVQVAKVANSVAPTSSSSDCATLGGTDLSC